MRWVDALKQWNQDKLIWCIPKRGTPEHAEVKRIMDSEPREQALTSDMLDMVGEERLAMEQEANIDIVNRLAVERDILTQQIANVARGDKIKPALIKRVAYYDTLRRIADVNGIPSQALNMRGLNKTEKKELASYTAETADQIFKKVMKAL